MSDIVKEQTHNSFQEERYLQMQLWTCIYTSIITIITADRRLLVSDRNTKTGIARMRRSDDMFLSTGT